MNSTATTHLLGLGGLQRLYESIRGDGDDLLPRLLNELRISTRVASGELSRIPSRGACLLLSNHPFGLLDGAVLLNLARSIRSDVKVLANDVLNCIPELRDLVIPINVLQGKPNATGMRAALKHLRAGGALIVFPAGEVARRYDASWSPAISRLIRLSKDITVVPVYVRGSNSLLFRLASKVHSRVGTMLLGHELLNKRGTSVHVRFGRPVTAGRLAEFESDDDCVAYLRWRTELLGLERSRPPARTARDRQPVTRPVPAVELSREVEALAPLCSSGALSAYVAPASGIPAVLQEIARLREIAFRAAGEGTGLAADSDRFDAFYLHLFAWNHDTHEIVGAYRLATTDGVKELYTATLFRYRREFLENLGPAIELGRSFVRVEYQRSFAPLLLLWKAICRFVHLHPQYKVLFGPVSISNIYSPFSRELIASFLEQRSFLDSFAALVSARNPFRFSDRVADRVRDLDDLSDAVADIEGSRDGVPVLLRQYLKLGGKLVGFNVDPEFSHALDGLIVVDLTETDPRLLDRYFGKAESKRFLEFHRGEYGANTNDPDSELDAARHSGSHPVTNPVL